MQKYPKLFAQKDWPPDKTCMNWCIETGNGWYEVIDKMCEELTSLINEGEEETKDIQFTQIKEKFGILRAYIVNGTKTAFEIIYKYEVISGTVCEDCGSKTQVTTAGHGWVVTLCKECRDKKGKSS